MSHTSQTGSPVEDSLISLFAMVKLDRDFALKFIPDFDGSRENLHRFISCCDVVDGDFSVADRELFLNIIKCKLTGPAYNVVKYKNFDKWEDLKKILLEQFLERRTLAQIQTELVNCKQGFQEDVRSYANRVEVLLSDLNDACVAAEGEEASVVVESLNGKTALKAFVDGLQNPVRLIIKASRFKKLSEAVEAAVEEEKSSGRQKSPTKVPTNIKCTFCHKTGHHVSKCYSKLNSSTLPHFNKTEVKREAPSPLKIHVLVCSYCKNRGHHIKDCRKRLFNENKKRQNASSVEQLPNQNSNFSENSRGPGVSGGPTRAENLR